MGGVTPVERVGGSCWGDPGVTTRTKTGQASDQTWRDLTTILVVDDVIPGVREALRARFPRAKNTAQTRGAVQSLVVEVLERKLAAEVITGYDAVEVTALGGRAGDLPCDIRIYGDPWDGSDLAERRGDGVRKEAVTWR